MKKIRKFNAGMALGSLTAAVALFAGVPVASAQTLSGGSDASVSGQAAAGGGSFPGSFLVPGTNTSLKIGGFAKLVYIYDMSASGGGANSTVVALGGIPLEGQPGHQLHGSTRIHVKQSNFNFDARTPTAWGELDTFIFVDFFGNPSTFTPANSNTENARLVLAYGTLGPVLAGQTQTLFFDGDAVGESVDPTTSIGVSNGLTNRQPQIRYTYVAGGGLSFAAAVEQPVFEAVSNAGGVTGTGAGTINRYPDFTARARWDQSWGHVQLAGVVRDQKVIAIGTNRVDETGWGINLSAHLNTFGKDTLRGGFIVGQSLGHYLSQIGVLGGVQVSSLAAGTPFTTKNPTEYGAHVDYTHWWTNELRSTVMAGYEHLDVDTATIITSALAQNNIDKMHIGGTVNLVWSPVPQVDFGIEYDWAHRVVVGPFPAANFRSQGMLNRAEAMAVFKF